MKEKKGPHMTVTPTVRNESGTKVCTRNNVLMR